jgi:Ca2+-transporting ATPase
MKEFVSMVSVSKTIRDPWAQSVDEVLKKLEVSSSKGLSESEVRNRRQSCGSNRLKKAKGRKAAGILFDQVKNLIVLLLTAATIVSFLFGQHLEAMAIIVAILLNVSIGFLTEWRATRSIETLRKMGATKATVRRNGETRRIDAVKLVPGDIVLLESGDIVAADLRILECSRLTVDESTLTGESVPVGKQVDAVDAQAELAERGSMLFKGTAMTRGSAAAVVVTTGMDTELGRIASMAEAAETEETPLEKRLNRLGYRLIWLTLAIAAAITLTGFIARRDPLTMIETAIALAVAAAPEGLPIVATIALARGMWRMLKRNALINRLSAVETLGSTSVILTDKTGTLTENRMAVRKIAFPGAQQGDIERVTVPPGTDTLSEGPQGKITSAGHSALKEILEIGVLCNNAGLEADGREVHGSGHGDPLEIALLKAAQLAGIGRKELLDAYPEAREEAFDRSVKMMATFHQDGNRYRVAVKGAPEAVLEASNRAGTADSMRKFDPDERDKWQRHVSDLAEEGFRVLAMATKTVGNREDTPYNGLRFLGLIGMEDPPRRDVPDAVKACSQAGIAVVMVTGDHPATAVKVAGQVGIVDDVKKARVVEGRHLQSPSADSNREHPEPLQARIFARVSPKQKLELVERHQAEGAVVAMTGDGVNDAPALKKADIGIAMGKRGTQVAREAADMVLQDDAFGTIVAAVAQGRAIFENIRKFILFLLSGNVGEILIVGAAILAGAPLPILPLQILYLNMIGDVFPALALAAGAGDAARMREPPRDRSEAILTRGHWMAIAAYGAVIATAVLGAFWVSLNCLLLDTSQAVTVSFLCLSFARLWHVFNMRDPRSGIFVNELTRNFYVWGALALCCGLLLVAVYLPGLSQVLKLTRPAPLSWMLILIFSALPLAAVQTVLCFQSRHRSKTKH